MTVIGASFELRSKIPEIKLWARKLDAVDFSLTGGYALIGKPLFPDRQIAGGLPVFIIRATMQEKDILVIGINAYDSPGVKEQSYCFLFEPNQNPNIGISSALSANLTIDFIGMSEIFSTSTGGLQNFLASSLIADANIRLESERYYTVPYGVPYHIPYENCFNPNYQAAIAAYAMRKVEFHVTASPGKRGDFPLQFNPLQILTNEDLQVLVDRKATMVNQLELDEQKYKSNPPPTNTQRLQIQKNKAPIRAKYNTLPTSDDSVDALRYGIYSAGDMQKPKKEVKLPSHGDILKYIESAEGLQALNQVYEKMIAAMLRKTKTNIYRNTDGDEEVEIMDEFDIPGAELVGAVSGYIMMKFRGEQEPFFFMDGLINHMGLLDNMEDESLNLLEILLKEQAGRFMGASKTMEILAQIVSGRPRKENKDGS